MFDPVRPTNWVTRVQESRGHLWKKWTLSLRNSPCHFLCPSFTAVIPASCLWLVSCKRGRFLWSRSKWRAVLRKLKTSMIKREPPIFKTDSAPFPAHLFSRWLLWPGFPTTKRRTWWFQCGLNTKWLWTLQKIKRWETRTVVRLQQCRFKLVFAFVHKSQAKISSIPFSKFGAGWTIFQNK